MAARTSPSFLGLWLLSGLIAAGCAAPPPVSVEGFLTLGNDRLYYELSGEGFPVVLVSGGSGMDHRQWDSVARRLARDYKVIRYDPRGIGRSDNPTARYSDAADLERLLDHLDLQHVALVGLSSSGGAVLEFGVVHPERVEGIVAAAAFVPGFEFSQEMLTRLNGFNVAAQAGREPFLDRMFEDPHFMPAPLDESVRVTARAIMTENHDKGADFDASLPIPMDPPLIERLSEIEAPVLLLAGELDHSEVLRRNIFLKEQIPITVEGIVRQAGHNAHMENPDGFLAPVELFLGGITYSQGE